MIFTSLTFLAFYTLLMGTLLLVQNTTRRQTILLLASYIFYGWWNPAFIILIIASSIWGWYLGLLMDRTDNESKKKFYLSISLILSLTMLGWYKYAEFFAENIVRLLGLDWDYRLGIILPVGISFFTFQTMSYGIDLKRGKIPVCKSLLQFMLFVAFFPQLVVGPIVRASEFLPQLQNSMKLSSTNFIVGAQIFLGGAIQKVLFADNLSQFVDPVFNQPELFSASTLWLAAFAYAIQIFCDFSGYSLMAIGVARTLGFELPKNFHMPYISQSITEFWHRWHITLSTWLRDYLYISLGGNRKGNVRTYLHLMITMMLGGLWHGASWNFVLWGVLHGIALALHKLWMAKTMSWGYKLNTNFLFKLFSHLCTLIFVVLLWVPFRSPDFKSTSTYYSGLFGNPDGVIWMHPATIIIMFASVIWHMLYLSKVRVLDYFPAQNITDLYPQFVIGFALLFIVMFAPLDTSPFIYFQF